VIHISRSYTCTVIGPSSPLPYAVATGERIIVATLGNYGGSSSASKNGGLRMTGEGPGSGKVAAAAKSAKLLRQILCFYNSRHARTQ
jgi:hypothetical protein